MVKKQGIPLPKFKLDKDGNIVRDEKAYNLIIQLKRKRSTRIRYKPSKNTSRPI